MLEKREVTILTPLSDCGYTFKLGEDYLVWANHNDEIRQLVTGLCDRTNRLTESALDVLELGEGHQLPNCVTV